MYSDPTYSSDPFIIYSDQSGSSKFFSINISGISTFGDGVNVSNYLKIDGSNVAIKDDVDASFALYTLTSDLYTKSQLESGNLDLSFQNIDISGILNLNNTTQSTSTTTGALIVDGGIGIAQNLNVGGILTVTGDTSLNSNVDISGNLTVNGSNVLPIPSQTNNNGKFLTTDGTNLSWTSSSGGSSSSSSSSSSYLYELEPNTSNHSTITSLIASDFSATDPVSYTHLRAHET